MEYRPALVPATEYTDVPCTVKVAPAKPGDHVVPDLARWVGEYFAANKVRVVTGRGPTLALQRGPGQYRYAPIGELSFHVARLIGKQRRLTKQLTAARIEAIRQTGEVAGFFPLWRPNLDYVSFNDGILDLTTGLPVADEEAMAFFDVPRHIPTNWTLEFLDELAQHQCWSPRTAFCFLVMIGRILHWRSMLQGDMPQVIYCLIGVPGSGKTTMSTQLFSMLLGDRHIFTVDPDQDGNQFTWLRLLDNEHTAPALVTLLPEVSTAMKMHRRAFLTWFSNELSTADRKFGEAVTGRPVAPAVLVGNEMPGKVIAADVIASGGSQATSGNIAALERRFSVFYFGYRLPRQHEDVMGRLRNSDQLGALYVIASAAYAYACATWPAGASWGGPDSWQSAQVRNVTSVLYNQSTPEGSHDVPNKVYFVRHCLRHTPPSPGTHLQPYTTWGEILRHWDVFARRYGISDRNGEFTKEWETLLARAGFESYRVHNSSLPNKTRTVRNCGLVPVDAWPTPQGSNRLEQECRRLMALHQAEASPFDLARFGVLAPASVSQESVLDLSTQDNPGSST